MPPKNDPKHWKPIGYILNLGYGQGTPNKTHTRDKIQEEHSCISFAFQSLKNVNKENGFQCVGLGCTVCVKVWIHYFMEKLSNNSHFITLQIDGQSPNLFYSNNITEAKKGHSNTSQKQIMIQTHHR